MATPFTVYKLIVLYMLQNTENTLTNSQISEFILDREYTNYFHLQQAISELVEAELITMDTRSNVSHYRITEDGIKTLSMSASIRNTFCQIIFQNKCTGDILYLPVNFHSIIPPIISVDTALHLLNSEWQLLPQVYLLCRLRHTIYP